MDILSILNDSQQCYNRKRIFSSLFMNYSVYFRQFLDCGNNRIDMWEEAFACHLQNLRTCLDGCRRTEAYGEHTANHIKLTHHLFVTEHLCLFIHAEVKTYEDLGKTLKIGQRHTCQLLGILVV